MPSQLGRQPQLMMISGGDGRRPFPEGLNRNIIPQNQSQHTENDPISTGLVLSAAGVGSGVTFRTESMTVSDARGTQPDPNMDDRRLRRLLSNRVSAQRSRMRRTNYINELENHVKELETRIAELSPELIVYQGKKKLLQLENELMKQKKTMIQEHLNLKHAETKAHQKEIYHLKQLFEMQQQQNQAWMSSCTSGPVDYMTNQGMYQAWPVQNMYQPWVEQAENPDILQPTGWENSGSLGISISEPNEKVTSEAYQPASEVKGLKEI
ncbi:Basic leucine zipper 61 [Vitis vinifera]|uniref:Basic leucine zipper 61 n=1 Tax=Vitis vinifera TaxID=29760 RepID=A0A438FAC8_VITVI|nr:Basic leucine zipper 61 [Vitis vinifera]